MKITELSAYNALEEMFIQKGYSQGIKNDMPSHCWDNDDCPQSKLTPSHYVYAIKYGILKFEDVPSKHRIRAFFLHTLSGVYEDIVEYVKTHPNKFDRQFFKDHIATNYYALEFALNDFEYMPLEFIDEEMVACAMFRSINARYVERRGDFDDWFYSVHKRKPEVLTQELYTLGARCFAKKLGGKNNFLDITPEEYRTPEYYFALCLNNDTPVTEDIPRNILTTRFLLSLLNDSPKNIQCFSEEALEREALVTGKGIMKLWQIAVLADGYVIGSIPLNDERVEFFLANYDKDTSEYEYGFKEHYKSYMRKKNSTSTPENTTTEMAAMTTLASAMIGIDVSSSIELGTNVMNALTYHKAVLPIHYSYPVPREYSKRYDREEYLLEIYNKIGIQVLQEADYYYYNVILPENISIIQDNYGYCVKDSDGTTLIHYYDRGTFYDRTVTVDQINVTL